MDSDNASIYSPRERDPFQGFKSPNPLLVLLVEAFPSLL